MKTILRTPYEVSTNTSSIRKATNYKNQMKFTGIKQDDNIYAIDQDSSRDAQNVYVDDNQRLSSRPALQSVALPEVASGSPAILELGDRLVDIQKFGSITIYVAQLTTGSKNYRIVAYNAEDKKTYQISFTIDNQIVNRVEKYHICSIDHYIICFNNIDAKIFDTDATISGWQKFTDFAEIPITKRIGSSIATFDSNQFTNKYKTEYIWSNESQPLLASGTPSKITLNSKSGQFDVTTTGMSDLNAYTNYRLLRPVTKNVNSSDYIVSCSSNGVVCYGGRTDFYISYNYGKTFERVYYPQYTGDWHHIAEVSKDGNYFFFVCTQGVFRCELSSLTWSNVFRRNNSGVGADLLGERDMSVIKTSIAQPIWKSGFRCYFLTGDVFCFELYDFNANKLYLYYKGNGLCMMDETYTATGDHMVATNPLDPDDDYYLLNYTDKVYLPTQTDLYSLLTSRIDYIFDMCNQSLSYKMITTTDLNGKTIAIILANFGRMYEWTSGNLVYIVGGDTSSLMLSLNGYMLMGYYNLADINSTGINGLDCNIYDLQWILGQNAVLNTLYVEVEVRCRSSTVRNYKFSITFNNNTVTVTSIDFADLGFNFNDHIHIDTDAYIYERSDGVAIQHYDDTQYGIMYKCVSVVNEILSFADNFFIMGNTYNSGAQYHYDFNVWTNYLQEEDSFLIDYTFGSAGNYTEVPDVTYSDTELYLSLANDLKITYNTKDPDDLTKTLFNLPAINNQSFIDNITAMINISTTEVALFFIDKIVICSKVADENLAQGFRYDYYNTKLSTGVRLGDSVINTLEGSYTIFPTRRGLAAMNYQAFMATTDQVIAYLSDVIKEIWTEFYDISKEIHIIQWRNRLVITNDSQYCLIFDIEEKAWWKWKVPVKFNKALSDQVFLQMIENSGTTDDGLNVFDPYAEIYFDHSDKPMNKWSMIEWFIMSQPLHFNQPNYYKNIKQLVFQLQDGNNTDGKVKQTIDAQVRLYRKKITTREPETIEFTIDGLRTFVKRFNYWKINELKWVLSYDENTASPYRFELNGVSVKYEIGDEVR